MPAVIEKKKKEAVIVGEGMILLPVGQINKQQQQQQSVYRTFLLFQDSFMHLTIIYDEQNEIVFVGCLLAWFYVTSNLLGYAKVILTEH